ncbi:MAG: adenine nucleotide alpha hydrolase [Salinisphaera sp.]|nr:adenine nucleotide alpha hydrolase [Salinisphaera sp.]
MTRRVLLSWSSGKDCAWTLHLLRQMPEVEVAGLLTTFNEAADRVAMHAVRRELVQAQARALGLPLWPVQLPWPCSNDVYEARIGDALRKAREAGVAQVAFGDLYLEDIRDYRIAQFADSGLEPIFPLWCSADQTPQLARQMVDAGLRAIVTCVDPAQMPERFLARTFDAGFLADLPAGVDPCGEHGEFHSFCYAGPMFSAQVPVQPGEQVTRDGFCFADLIPA